MNGFNYFKELRTEKHIKWGIQLKLTISFTTVFIILLFIVIEMFYNNMILNIKQETIGYSSLYIKQLNENINKYINEYERLTAMPLSDIKLQSILASDNPKLSRAQIVGDNDYISNFLFNIYTFQPDIKNIVLVSSKGKLYSEGVMRYYMEKINIGSLPWYIKAIQEKGKIVLYPNFHNDDAVIYNYADFDKTFSIVRHIKSIETGNEAGVIRIDIPFKRIREIIEAIRKDSSIKIVIFDNNHNIIIDSNNIFGSVDPEKYKNIFSELRDNERGYHEFDMDGDRQMLVYDVSPYTKWNIVGFISQDQLLERSKNIRNLTMLITIIGIIIILVICAVLTRAITKPIKKLQSSMREVEKGNFDVNIEINTKDEIGYLGKRFNKMVSEINRLIKNEYELTIKKREAELKALIEEINPHFLYNTLESIRGKAIINNAPDVAEMIEALSKFFRLNIIRGSGLVALKEEIEHIKSYISIQNMRFGDKFNTIIDIDDELIDIIIPKLSLQPLIENSILHGFKLQNGECIIIICCRRTGGDAVVEIIDNGSGISGEELMKTQILLSCDYKEDKQGTVLADSHLGIKNVNERIKLHFGERYGLYIDSKQGAGTRVKIVIPYQVKGKEDGNHDKRIAG